MKKVISGLIAVLFTVMAFGQQDPMSAIFEKYSGKEGFTTVNITGDMLKLLSQMEEERRDTMLLSKLDMVNILAIDKDSETSSKAVDFRSEVYDKLDKSVFKEMMTVKQNDEDVIILLKELNGRISEILIIVGGKEDNALIRIKGDIVLSEIADIAGEYQMKGFEQLKNLEK